jgi:cytochrome P450
LFRYEDVAAVAADAHLFSNRDNQIPSDTFSVKPPPVQIDPPVHMQYRQPFLKKFSPNAIAALEPAIRVKANSLIDPFIERGSADLAQELFLPFPAYGALKLLNLPEADFPRFAHWAHMVFSVDDGSERHTDWTADVIGYLAPLYESLRGSTADDIPSIARALLIEGREIQVMEFVLLLTTFVTAGLDTTTNSATNMVLLLAEHPALCARLVEDPTLIPAAIEEMLRYITPVPILARTTNRATRIGTGDDGVEIGPDEKVALRWMAANHDPAEFQDPEDLIFDRSPNRHLSFGLGPHRCIGAHLARLQLRIVLGELLRRIPEFEVDRERVVRIPGITRQIRNLPVRFQPGPQSISPV